MPARGVGAAAGGLALLGLALLAGFTALPRGGPRATVLNSVEAAAQHAAGGELPLHGARRGADDVRRAPSGRHRDELLLTASRAQMSQTSTRTPGTRGPRAAFTRSLFSKGLSEFIQ